jgi:hypothetical protein
MEFGGFAVDLKANLPTHKRTKKTSRTPQEKKPFFFSIPPDLPGS